jgi:hypothetical protein
MYRVFVQCTGFGYNAQVLRYNVQGLGTMYRVFVQCTGFGYNVKGFCCNVQGLGTMYRVWVQCTGFGVKGLRCSSKVCNLQLSCPFSDVYQDLMQVPFASFDIARRATPPLSRALLICLYRTRGGAPLLWVFLGGTKRTTALADRRAFLK